MCRSWLLVGTVVVPLVTLSCAPAPPAPEGRPAEEGERAPALPKRSLVVAVRGEPPSIASRPVVNFSGSLRRPRELFNALLDFRDEREIPRAQLVEALPQLNTETWRVFPDGRMETTYKLRANLTWHDGRALSAEDFAFAWRVYASPDLGAAVNPIGHMGEVFAHDPRTVVIRWRQPYADAGSLDHDFQALPRHVLEEPFRDLDPIAFSSLAFWTSEYVGLGPYRVTGWEPGAFIEGEAFDGYVLGRPKIDRIQVVFITDPQTAVANILAGAVHLVADPVLSVAEGETIEQRWAQDQGGIVLYSPVGLRQTLFQVRPDYAEPLAFLDVRVRRAVRFGIDAATAVEVFTAGKGVTTYTLTSPRVDFYSEIERVVEKYAYDPRRAQQLMEEAGFMKGPDGFFAGGDGKPLQFSMASSAGERQEIEVAIYVASLRQAGFDASQRIVPVQQIRDPQVRALLPGMQVRGGGEGVVRYTSEQIPRPENRWHGDNRGGWSNAEYDRLFRTYASTLDRSERVRQLAQLERILNEDAAIIPNIFNPYAVPHVAALQGPVARHTALSGDTFLHVHTWEWRS